MTKAKDLVFHYGMHQDMGLRLIHSHYQLDDTQLMVENFKEVDGIPSLVTSPHVLHDFVEEALPTGWIFSSSNTTKPIVFESSTDKAVRISVSKLSSEPEFMKEIGNLIRHYHFEDLIALGVINRDSLMIGDGEMLLELNSENESLSVVQVKPIIEIKDSIKTSWSFDSPLQHGCFVNWHCINMGQYGGHVRGSGHAYYPQ